MGIGRKLGTYCLAAAIATAALPVSVTPAFAASNILEQGWSDKQLINHTVYYWQSSGNNTPVVIGAVDRAHGSFWVRWPNGQSSWVAGSNLYTADQAKLADQQWNTGWGIVGLAALAAILAGSGDHSSSHSGSSSGSGSSNQHDQDNIDHQAYCPGVPQGPLGHPCDGPVDPNNTGGTPDSGSGPVDTGSTGGSPRNTQ